MVITSFLGQLDKWALGFLFGCLNPIEPFLRRALKALNHLLASLDDFQLLREPLEFLSRRELLSVHSHHLLSAQALNLACLHSLMTQPDSLSGQGLPKATCKP